MAKISFLSNIASLQAQRRLTENTKELSKTNERLSSGLRITRASDDAAGIAIAASLNVDARVFGQAIRNLNDGISLLNVAEGGLTGLREIVFRLRELGEQSANGVLTSVQRQSIDGEGQALISEYNRIISVTEFNGLKLLDGSLTNLTLQAGYGKAGELAVSIGQQLQRNLGVTITTTTIDGTFQAVTSYTATTGPSSVVVGDVNGDGKLDVISSDVSTGKVSVFLANGNGTFQATTTFTGGTAGNLRQLKLGDVNGDGKLDIVTLDNNSGVEKVNVLLGNGNGSFQASTSYTVGTPAGNPRSIAIGDLNGDGKLDLAVAVRADTDVDVLLGNGNGSFGAYTAFNTGLAPNYVAMGDLNGDGKLDVVSNDYNANKISVFLGNGNGSLQARLSYAAGSAVNAVRTVELGDVNGDGKLDVLAEDFPTGKVLVYLGNGNGTLNARASFSVGTSPRHAIAVDVNADGKLDLVVANSGNNTLSVLLGNGNGSFQAQTSLSSGVFPISVAAGDLNSNGGVDIVIAEFTDNKVGVFLANTTTTSTSTSISFLTQASSLAALTTLASVQTSIENELANIGSIQSRLGTALINLQQTRENYNAAESRIVDVDVAEESANLVKRQILQDAASAILAQANQEPGLLLRLLKP